MQPMRCPALLLAALLALPFAGPAAAEARSQADVLEARVLPGWQTEGGTRIVAIALRLAPEWKTYWRSPGDAGIPPIFDWSGSENLAEVRYHWPRPHVFELNGMQTIGYKQELVLPIELTAIDPSQPIRLRAEVDLGVCRDICMPASLQFDSTVGGRGAPDARIVAALENRPLTGREAGLASISCEVEPISDGLRVTARMDLPPTGGAETVVIEPNRADVWVSEAAVDRKGRRLTASADLVPDSARGFVLDRGRLTVTVLGRDSAVEIPGCPAP